MVDCLKVGGSYNILHLILGDTTYCQIKTGCSKERQGNLYSSKQHLAGSFMADRSTFKWLLTGEINQKKYFIPSARV